MASYTDLEIGLYHISPGACSVELRLSQGGEPDRQRNGDEIDRRWTRPINVSLELEALQQAAASADMEEYGRRLG
ncbi:MAG: hypothetical protein ACXU86_11480 [Archangium sp.]